MTKKKGSDLAALTVDELLDMNRELMEGRAAAEAEFRAQQMAVQAELDARAVEANTERVLEGMSEAQKAALAAALSKES